MFAFDHALMPACLQFEIRSLSLRAGQSKKVANSPLEGGGKAAGQASRLTAYDKHLREWDGEPLG